MSSTSMQRFVFNTFMIPEKIQILKFLTNPDTSPTKNMYAIFLEQVAELHNNIVHDLLMYVATLQCLNYSGQENKKRNLHFDYVSDIPVTLKQGLGQQS